MKTALVTGGSRGIGAATVRAFGAAGYRVAFLYHESEAAAQALARDTGALALPCDVRESAQVNRACADAQAALGHIDALVCSAAIAQQKLFSHLTDGDWQDMLAVNLSGSFYAARAVLPAMVSRKEGQIVFLSSMWGQVGGSMEVSYSATKGALIAMTRALAKEVAPSNVRVNCVAPGVIDTDMNKALGPDTLCALAEEIPLGHLGTPQEVAQCILWLCSSESRYVTGQVLGVNGGIV